MEGLMKKLALWHTRTFRPIMTHDDLEPIMTALGFVAVPLTTAAPPENQSSSSSNGSSGGGSGGSWKEYAFSPAAAAASARPKLAKSSEQEREQPQQQQPLLPRPRLPFPRIDGLHLLTYRAFIDAVGFYIGTQRVADHFHVRGMPLHRVHDRIFDKVFRRMSDERRMGEDEGIFVFREGTLDQKTKLMFCSNTNAGGSSSNINANLTCLVPLKDIILLKDIKV